MGGGRATRGGCSYGKGGESGGMPKTRERTLSGQNRSSGGSMQWFVDARRNLFSWKDIANLSTDSYTHIILI